MMRRIPVAAAAFPVFVLLASRPAAAQQRDTARADSASVAQSGRARQTLPAINVTGTLAGSAEGLGVARSVVGRAELAAEPHRAAVDPLRVASGVWIDEAAGPLGPTIVRLRGGEESFTQVLVDGVQINENGGFFDWAGVSLVNVDRVEIARGPQSALYGSSAMSGALQIFSRAGRPGRTQAEGAFEGGRTSSYGGAGRGMVEVSGGSDVLRYAAGAGSAYERGPYALPHDLRTNDASLRLDLVPRSSPFQLTAVARLMSMDEKLPVRDPGVTRTPLDPNQKQGHDRWLGALHAAWTPSARWTHRLSVSRYQTDFTYSDQHDGIDASAYPFFVFDFNYDYKQTVTRQTARYVGTVSGDPSPRSALAFSYGAQWERETLDSHQAGDFGPATVDIERPSVAGFAEGTARLADRVSLLAGARVEKFRGLDAQFVPRATMVVDVVPRRLALRAAVGRAFKAPNIQDQFPNNPYIRSNPDLRPETSTSVEGGIDLTGARTTASVTVFRQRYDNLIRSVPYDTTGVQINRNLGRSRATGVEVEGALRPAARWTLGAAGAWTATRIVDNAGLPPEQFPGGGSLPFRPTYALSGYAEVPAARTLSLLARLSAIGPQTVLTERFSGTRAVIDPYRLLAATLTWNASPSLDAYVHGENVLGTRYSTAYDRPGAPRAVAVGVRVRR